ncbi:MAG: di-heme oxidoredictase family protein, partial [Myxococcota bacterium]|nr:di-heme oxidoredictase family protein [Myxococcota bacterium]
VAQELCLSLPSGGEPEIEQDLFDKVVLYTSLLAVPVRRDWEDKSVLKGKALFNEIGCAGCHTPNHTTEAHFFTELSHQKIWPYTDLLLHDMGDGLADGRAVFDASGREWKTPPLWGIGLVESVNHHTRFLHDGRARNLTEAILWHGGESAAAQKRFINLSADERENVLTFVKSL